MRNAAVVCALHRAGTKGLKPLAGVRSAAVVRALHRAGADLIGSFSPPPLAAPAPPLILL